MIEILRYLIRVGVELFLLSGTILLLITTIKMIIWMIKEY